MTAEGYLHRVGFDNDWLWDWLWDWL